MNSNTRRLIQTALAIGTTTALATTPPIEGVPDYAFGGSTSGVASVSYNLTDASYDETAGLARASNGALWLASRVRVMAGGIRRYRFALARLNADGTPDSGFSGDGQAVPSVPDANLDYQAFGMALAPDGKPIIHGYRNDLQNQQFDGVPQICRYNVAGNPDNSFHEDGCAHPAVTIVEGEGGSVSDVDVLPDGSLLLTGIVEDNPAPGADWSVFVYKLTANGEQDNSYGDGGLPYRLLKPVNCDWCVAKGSVAMPDGTLYVFGSNELSMSFVARLTPLGTLDQTFGAGGYSLFSFANLHNQQIAQELPAGGAIDSQGRVYHCGYLRIDNDNGKTLLSVARFTPDGQLDSDFSGDGRLLMPFVDVLPMSTIRDCKIDAQDRLVLGVEVGGEDSLSSDFGLMRLLPSGDLDPMFNLSGQSLRGIDLGGPGIGHDEARQFVFDAGGIVMAGTSNGDNANTSSRKLTLLRWRDETLLSDGFE